MTAKGKGAKLVDWQTEALETIDSSTNRLVELTDDLLDVTRLQAGRLALRLEPADLVALTRRVLKRLQVTAPQHTLRLETDHDFIVTKMDAQRIEQVLGNLINNAIKYSPEGGEVTLILREPPDQGTAELAIRDQGIGIPEGQQARILGASRGRTTRASGGSAARGWGSSSAANWWSATVVASGLSQSRGMARPSTSRCHLPARRLEGDLAARRRRARRRRIARV